MIAVLLFGPVAERAGTSMLQFEHRSGLTLQQLREELASRHPQAFGIVSFTAVNGEQARDPQLPLKDGDEVAFMAKFSGG
ncbi:MAG TPA: MoaD/ThiS family protein [Gallionella sp.]|nr:MoaD/ThiS family protein [Gallionella sp.]